MDLGDRFVTVIDEGCLLPVTGYLAGSKLGRRLQGLEEDIVTFKVI